MPGDLLSHNVLSLAGDAGYPAALYFIIIFILTRYIRANAKKIVILILCFMFIIFQLFIHTTGYRILSKIPSFMQHSLQPATHTHIQIISDDKVFTIFDINQNERCSQSIPYIFIRD